jgi:hypothetical protein
LLNRFQSFFDALHVGAILRGAFNHLLGEEAAHSFLILEPPPETDPNHGEKRNRKNRHYQERFLIGEDFDDAVAHISLLI